MSTPLTPPPADHGPAGETPEREIAQPSQFRDLGWWPLDYLGRAFVEGAKWWQFKANGATAFASEVDEMEAEAERRYPLPPSHAPRETEITSAPIPCASDSMGSDDLDLSIARSAEQEYASGTLQTMPYEDYRESRQSQPIATPAEESGTADLVELLARRFETAPERPDDTWLREGNNNDVADWCNWAEAQIAAIEARAVQSDADAQSWHRNYDSANAARRKAEERLAQLEQENTTLQQQVETLQQRDAILRRIEAVCARRPALDKPTLPENIEYAITVAGRKTDECVRLEAKVTQLEAQLAAKDAELARLRQTWAEER